VATLDWEKYCIDSWRKYIDSVPEPLFLGLEASLDEDGLLLTESFQSHLSGDGLATLARKERSAWRRYEGLTQL